MNAPPLFQAPMLDVPVSDLQQARRIGYRIEQCFTYTYDSPVADLSQRLVMVPRPRHGDTLRRAHRIDVVGAHVRRRTRQNAAGNTVVRVDAERVEHSVQFRLIAVLERRRAAGPSPAPRPSGRPTRLTAPDERLRALAAEQSRPAAAPAELAERLCTAAHAALTYRFGVTTVQTTAAEAIAGGVGVCQDAAHIMLALCHASALPARYVSGHLLGQGGTHAWVEVLLPDRDTATVVAFDPTHGRRTDERYLTVAVGRDYVDVAPTSGSYVGAPGGRLTCARRVGVVAID